MIKAIMVLKKNQIPPQLNFINPKPSLHLEERGIKVPLELCPLAPEGHTGPRRVSVNSFGYGGTNAHAIIEAFEPAPLTNGYVNGNGLVNGNGHVNGTKLFNGTHQSLNEQLVVLSANSELSLTKMIAGLRQWAKSDSTQSTSFDDLVYTLNVRRSKLPWRCSVVASDFQELATALSGAKLKPVKAARDVALAFVFTGQGAQWYAMGRELLESSRAFAASVAACNEDMQALGCAWDLVEELSRDNETSRLGQAAFSQPSCTAVQIALVDLLGTFGIRPAAVCGHSSGEIAAAYAAGALTRQAAMEVAYMRGICSSEAKSLNATQGAMLAVGEGEEAINQKIKQLDSSNGRVTVACVNSPESTTISGDLAAIQKLQSVLDAASVFNRRLAVDSAYHSHHMEVVAQSYLSSLEEMPHSKPREDVAFYSSVTASRKKSGFGPAYWVSNLVSQVKFSAAAQLVAQHFEATSATVNAVMVEVGPHSALSGPLRQSLSDFKLASGAVFKYNYVPCLIRKESAIAMVLALAGKVFEAGHPVELEAVRIGEEEHKSHPSRRRVVENLPTYPWDHSSTYWHESRLSKKHRQRAFPPHDLLGLFDVQSSPYEPRWRYHVSLEALPWLRDHMVEGFVIFPGVGYLIMVLEAMKQLFQLRGTPGRIRNINFRDVTFAKPVVVHDDAKKGNREVELQLVLSPSRQHAGSPWEHFRVLSYDALNDAWIDHCAGFASWDGFVSETPSQPHADEVVGARDDGLGHLTKAAADQWLQDIREGCPTAVDAEQTYQELRASGNEYGPSFQGLKEIHVGKQYGLAKVVVDDVVQQMPGHYMQPHTIHPTAFDSLIQLVAVVFRRECTVAPMMPVSLGEVSVAVDMDSTPGTEVTVALHLTPETKREATANFCAYIKQSDGTYRPVVTGFAIRPQAVGDADSDEVQKKMTYRMEWKPDVNHVTHNDFMDHAEVNGLFDVDLGKTSQDPAEVQLQLNDTVATIFIRRAVQRAREEGISTACKPHLTMLLNWMMKWDQSDALQFLEGVTPEDEEKLIEQASRSNIVGLTLSRLGPQYLDLFTGRKDALELLVQEELLGRLYSEYTLFNCHYAQMADYMQALVHKNPRMRVLEIGAGTGGATMPLLRRIERDGRLPVDAYTYTDISAGFFEKARAKFGAWAGQMRFQTLDVARDPLAQGYAAGSFDLIVASIVLHATPLMDVTVAHARALLRPGGRLVLMELTAVAAAQNAIFGTLEGWWMAADGRRDGPLLTVPEWDACLKRHGFSGTDLAIPAQKGRSSDVSTVIVATALPETAEASESTDSQPAAMKANIHLGDSEDASQVALGKELIHSLSEKGADCSQEAWSTEPMAEDPNRLTIVVDSAEHPLLLDPSQETFERIRHLLLQTANVLWVSFQGSEPSGEKEALKNMANGLAKVVRRENPGLRLVTVDVQDPVQTEALGQVGRTITELAHSSFWSPEATRADENEYAIRGGQVHIPRIVPDDRFAKYIDSRHPEQEKGEAALVECKYLDKARPLVFDVQMPGLLNTIRFVDNEEMAEPLGPDQVEVQAQAYGLNFKDVFVALGQMAPGTEMASEVAGVITAVGSNVDTWKAGDRVAAIMVAPFGNLVRVDKRGLAAIPGSLSFEDAASVTIVYYTAWYCLHQVARLEPGQSVLIHAASGGVGQAAIQLAQHAGAEVFATVSTAAKKRLVQARYGIPDSHVFSSHTRHFKKHLLAATRGRGVDVVLNSLAGQLLMDSWDCVAQFGTFVEIGKSDINGRSQLGMANFEKQATFASVDVSHMYRQRPERVTRGFAEVFSLLDRGLVKLVHPVTQYPMSRIEEAFRLMAARKHVGKLVLVADEDTMVRATKPKAPALRLQREGTYVIGGGLGDLGKRMGRFLAEKGAGHIVALTRRNVDAQEQAPLKEAISELGATLHIVQCDIGDEDSTRAAAKEIADLPPVRGVIQSALVLCDHPLEYMEVGDWKTAVKPKVQGTLNMHAAFCSPETTDFFVMLSSVASVIGSNSQSNYAAGNAFQDAFAHAQKQYPHGITHYTTINIGAVEGSDQIARALDQKSEIVKIIGSVSFADVFATLEYAMGGQARADEARQCLMHFSRDTMEDAAGAEALADHIYDHIPSQRAQGDKTANGASDKDKPSALQAVQQAPSVADAETIVRQALLDKFVAFIGDEVPDDQPVSSLGLDSLVSIELKNWVKHTFHTPLQTSELSGAPSVVALAKLVVSRMELKCKASVAVPEEEEKRNETTAGLVEPEPEPKPATATNGHVNGIVNGTNGVTKAQRVPDCCKFHSEVPAQPLPDLDDTLDYWLQANEHLFSPEQLEPIYKDFKAMRAADSPARQILEDLYRQHGHDKTNGWFTDVVTDARFLCSRAPIAPGSSIMGGHRGSDKIQSQAERAAVITCAARSFKRAAKAGEVEPLQIAGKPECTWRWGWMFNSTRVPKPKCDKMVSYASDEQIVRQDHVAVLRKGHVFRVALQDADGKDTPFKQLEATFDAIVDRVEGEGVWSGLLTTDDRDSWAEVRTEIPLICCSFQLTPGTDTNNFGSSQARQRRVLPRHRLGLVCCLSGRRKPRHTRRDRSPGLHWQWVQPLVRQSAPVLRERQRPFGPDH